MATARRRGAEGMTLGQRAGGGAAHKGADAHKARVAQGQLAGDAHHQVQGQGHGHIGADGDELALQHGAHAAVLEGAQQLDDHKGHNDHGVGKHAGPGGLVHGRKSFHTDHLTLSRARSCPADRRA